MSFYLDTHAIYSLVFADAQSQRIDDWIASCLVPIFVSDWSTAVFYSRVSRRVRRGGPTQPFSALGVAEFEALRRSRFRRLPLADAAGALAADAPRLALAATGGHTLVTFDKRLADAANARGYPFEVP